MTYPVFLGLSPHKRGGFYEFATVKLCNPVQAIVAFAASSINALTSWGFDANDA